MPWTNTGKALFAQGFVCLWSSVNASFYGVLISNNWVPSESAVYASAFSGAELSSISYTAGYGGTGRISLTARVLNVNQLSNQIEYQCGTLSWAGLSAGTVYAFAVIHQSGTDALSPILGYTCAGGLPAVTANTNLTISFSSAGVFDTTD